MNFSQWIDTFLEEKGVDLDEHFEFDNQDGFNIMPYAYVVENLKTATPAIQNQVQTKLIQIDFQNGDVTHFLRYLGQGMAGMEVPQLAKRA